MIKIRAWLSNCPTITMGTVTAAVSAIITLLLAYGVQVTPDQRIAIMGLVATIGPLLVGGVAKVQTTPTSHVVAEQNPSTGDVLAGEASPHPTGTKIDIETVPVEDVSGS